MHADEIQTAASGLIAAIIGSAASTGVGMALGGIVAVLAVSAIFYAIGRGEDRDRARATRERPAAVEEPGASTAKEGAPRSRLPAKPRMRRRR
jgi:hypothetical protein